ncbi:MAG: trehalose-phosphatase [Devosia sp.]
MRQTDSTTSQTAPMLAIFTDFDGTLVDLAETPDAIEVPDTLPDQLARTARELNAAFAVLTGREITEIDRFLAPLLLPVAGAHGTQRRRADGVMEAIDPASLTGALTIAQAVEPLMLAHPELILETKQGAVAIHFRQAPELESAVRQAMQQALEANEHFMLVPGKMVFEARPRGASKGDALRAFMLEEPFIGRTPVFIGDDVTDEDGFIAAQELGGVGIKLGAGDTAARMRIADVVSVRALLQGLGDIAAREHAFAPKH